MKAQFLLGRAPQLASNWANISDLVKVGLSILLLPMPQAD